MVVKDTNDHFVYAGGMIWLGEDEVCHAAC